MNYSYTKSQFMEKMNDLSDLLKHEIQDLYSAEEQIVSALPNMIEKAKNPDLKKALKDHLQTTRQHLSRLEQVKTQIGSEKENDSENKGLFSRLFKSRQVCRGMQGLIEEGNKIMGEDMHPDVLDAAIIASAQKIEHYEICGYGTARTFARELGLEKAAQLLEQTLNEEYEADDLLTQLAVMHINREAETASRTKERGASGGRSAGRAGARERARQEEPEMEMVSGGRTDSSKKTTVTGRSGAAPKTGETPRTNTSASRTKASPGRSVASRKTENKQARGNSRTTGSGRGGSSSGSRSRGR
jgi:ferritin-like metal-binding protein YciE